MVLNNVTKFHKILIKSIWLRPKKKKSLDSRFSSTFWRKKNRWRRQLFFFLLFPQKTDKACISWAVILSDNVPWEVYYGPWWYFGPIQEPCWTLNQAIFLKNGPLQLHDRRRHYKERCDACIPALNHIKNQYQAPTRFSEDRVNVWGILNIGRT